MSDTGQRRGGPRVGNNGPDEAASDGQRSNDRRGVSDGMAPNDGQHRQTNYGGDSAQTGQRSTQSSAIVGQTSGGEQQDRVRPAAKDADAPADSFCKPGKDSY